MQKKCVTDRVCIDYGTKKFDELPVEVKEEINEAMRVYNSNPLREEILKKVLQLMERKKLGREVIPSDCFILYFTIMDVIFQSTHN